MSSSPRALASLHLAVLLFGVSGLIGRVVAAPALVVSCVRSLVASLVLVAFLAWQRPMSGVKLRARRTTLLLSGALLAAHWWAFFEAIQRSTVALGLLTFASYPVFVAILGVSVLRERLRWTEAAACSLVVGGLALVVPDWHFGSQVAVAAGLGIGSGFSFALLTLVNRRLTTVLDPLLVVAVQTGVAGLVLLPLAGGHLGRVSGSDWLWLGLLGVLFTAVAHGCFTASLTGVRLSTVGVTTALEPVYGVVLAALFLGERPGFIICLGGGLIIAGAVLVRSGPGGRWRSG
jgi:drug/metabolite transporter (DMT)-like permease